MQLNPSGRLPQDRAQAGDGPAEGVLGRGAIAHDQGRAVVPSRHAVGRQRRHGQAAGGGPGAWNAISVSTRAWDPGSCQP